ncbi:hypothetical protein Bca52824_036606 [Brassica carinata]|uniref:Xylanase inhibitor C-terminal domain-containing protein n=1 Tax=Brassica carinata TaxID=52824 RepID=A0A8X7V2S9_BRACI|nr:hypothetical protein Bca52824_036606 [Brassica carinata]
MSEISGHAPFNHWFDESGSGMNMEELTNVPVIELGLPGREGEVKWRFHGKNTVVRVSEKVICLAFVDGGEKPIESRSMGLGIHQLQEYIINFGMSTTRMGFY